MVVAASCCGDDFQRRGPENNHKRLIGAAEMVVLLEGSPISTEELLPSDHWDFGHLPHQGPSPPIAQFGSVQFKHDGGHCCTVVSLHTLRLESLKLIFQPLHKFLVNKLKFWQVGQVIYFVQVIFPTIVYRHIISLYHNSSGSEVYIH